MTLSVTGTKRQVVLLAAITVCVASTGALRGGLPPFVADGTLKNVSGDKVTAEYKFLARLDQCRWAIYTTNAPTNSIFYYEDSFDGRDMYSYNQYGDDSHVANSSSAVIEETEVPHENSTYVTPVWLALASGCYFDHIKDNKVKLFFNYSDVSLRLTNLQVPVSFIRGDKGSPGPISVDFYDDGNTYIRKKGVSESHRRFPPYDKGFISKRFLVTDFTNVSGLRFPRAFQLKWYRPRRNATNATDLDMVFTQFGTVENLRLESSGESFVPQIDKRTLTEDRRFSTAQPSVMQLSYVNTNGDWLPTKTPSVAALYHDTAKLDALRNPMSVKTKKRVTYLLFALINLGIFILIVLWFKRPGKTSVSRG